MPVSGYREIFVARGIFTAIRVCAKVRDVTYIKSDANERIFFGFPES